MPTLRGLCYFFLLAVIPMIGNSQSPGGRTYQFLDLVGPARVAALGGDQIAVRDDDLTLGIHQPAAIDSSMDDHLALNFVNHFAGVNYGFASFSNTFDNAGPWAATLQYVNYGEFTRTGFMGFEQGKFTAGEYALNISTARWLDTNFTIGGTFKGIYSKMERLNSFGVALDAGAMYYRPDKGIAAGLLIRNLGVQLKSYHTKNRQPLPFEVKAGITKKLAKAPLRFGFIFHDLQQWDLSYTTLEEKDTSSFDLGQQNENGSQERFEGVKEFGDNFLRHLILNMEIMLTENFHLRLGYDYRRRMELRLTDKPGFVGVSWGFGFKIDRFHLSYGRSSYHLAGGSNHITVTTDLSSF